LLDLIDREHRFQSVRLFSQRFDAERMT